MVSIPESSLLRTLFDASDPLPLQDLSQRSGLDETQIITVIGRLEKVGFDFSWDDSGLALIAEPRRLVAEAIHARLNISPTPWDIVVFQETSSTNDRVREAGLAGAPGGLVVFAESQSAGRGTYGRKWVSRFGEGLWFSILLRERLPLDQSHLIVRTAVAWSAAILNRYCAEPVLIVPPNDLFLGGGKLAGFLLETSTGWNFQILGIGVNIYSAPELHDQPTSFLQAFTGSQVNRAQLAADLLNTFEQGSFQISIQNRIDQTGRS